MTDVSYRVLLVGPIAAVGRAAAGGYESANRRTVDGLRNMGLDVDEVPYPANLRRGGKVIRYAVGFACALWELVKRRHHQDCLIVHVTGVYKHFVYFEFLLGQLCMWFGARFVYDIRAGSALIHYGRRTPIYRRVFDALIKQADLVLVEGQEYFEFVRTRSGRDGVYFPNYINIGEADLVARAYSASHVRLCYCGRVVREKGLIGALETVAILRDAGVACELHIIGTGPADFFDELREIVDTLSIKDVVRFHGQMSPSGIKKVLSGMHFFLFLTRHVGEGHSNALTEAMSMGVVPVCTDTGFNRSVVMKAGVVVPLESSSDDVAAEMLKILRTNSWLRLSATCTARVRKEYSADIVLPRLLVCYSKLCERQHRCL